MEVSQAVARHLGVAPGQLCLLHDQQGTWLFHFWGDLYGALLALMLKRQLWPDDVASAVTSRDEYSLYLPGSLRHLPPWDEAVARNALRHLMPRVAAFLDLGRFHGLLPLDLAYQAAVAQSDLPRMRQAYTESAVVEPSPGLRHALLSLLD
jgi:hypothetical protein